MLIGDRSRCLEAGMNDYVTKPVDVPLLLSTLRAWVERSRVAADQTRSD